MTASPFATLRRRLALVGGRASDAPAEAAQGRRGDASFRPAELLEGDLVHHVVGTAVPFEEEVAFLDGTQHVELIGYVGTVPVVAAIVRAAVRLRRDRRLSTAVFASRRIVVACAAVIAQLGPALDGHEPIEAAGDEPPHPIRDWEAANATVDRVRGELEIRVAREFRAARSDGWLLVDGSLSVSPDWATDNRMIGIIKSYASLPFEGAALERYLTLPQGCRTSVFAPQSSRVAPVHSWGLRLHDFVGRDLFHGLIRVEVAATAGALARATPLSRHLLAERAPLSNDSRADRLLYGVHDVERYLRAQGR